MTSTSPPEDPALPQSMPSSSVRTTVSFLLFLHLFALFVAVASNFRPVSALRRNLRRAPFIPGYLQLLHMDLGYNYQLTYASEEDTDHFVEIQLNWQGKTDPGGQKLLLPEPSIVCPMRRNRYQNLTQTMASLIGQDSVESELPAAIAQGLLRENGISEGRHRFRLRRHFLLRVEDVKSLAESERDPYNPRRYGTAYEADVKLIHGKVFLVKAAKAGETAPAERKP